MSLFTWNLQELPAATQTIIAARSMRAMVEAAATARGPYQLFLNFIPQIATTIARGFLAITLLLAITGEAITFAKPAQGAEIKGAIPTPTPERPLTYDDSVKIAINQSPYFTESALKINITRMDESDSRYGMIPALTFRTYYYVTHPENITGLTSRPYSLSFTTDGYNPVGAYFTLQAKKLATQIAILGHLGTISKGLQSLGQFYLELEALSKLARYQRDLIKLAEENLTYIETRSSLGKTTGLEVKVAQQELKLNQGEQKQIAMAQERALIGLRNFLGLPSNQAVNPDFHDSPQQVLGNFDPATTTWAQVKSRSYELKATELYKQLQEYNVSLAISRVFPSILFTTQTPDPLSVTNGSSLYVGFGLEIPVWDGFSRIRNISRQKVVLKQIASQKEVKGNDLENKWHAALSDLQEKSVAFKMAQSQEELAQLKGKQSEIRYQSGEVLLPVVLESRKEILRAQKETVRKGLDYKKETLKLREISGDLGNTYVNTNSCQQ
jgi:outer membrane protein TolC